MQHLDEGTIHAWLDGALSADEARRIEAHLAECTSCASAVAEARGLIAASSRILSALDIVAGDVIPAAPVGPPASTAAAPSHRGAPTSAAPGDDGSTRRASSRWLPRAARIAAVIALVAIGASLATRIIGDRTTRSATLGTRNESISPTASNPAMRSGVQAPQIASAKRAAPVPTVNASAGVPANSNSLDQARTSTSNALAGAEPGRAARPAPVQLRLVSADQVVTPDARVVQRRIYEVRPGVRVILEEAAASADHLAPAEKRAGVRAFAPTAAPAPEKRSKLVTPADSAGLNSIHWTDSTGTQFTLTGRLTVEELRRLKGVVH